MKVGIVQQSNTADKAANIAKSLKGIEECKQQGAELVVLQELHCGLYFCQSEDTEMFNLAEAIPGDITQIFSDAANTSTNASLRAAATSATAFEYNFRFAFSVAPSGNNRSPVGSNAIGDTRINRGAAFVSSRGYRLAIISR